MACLAMHGHEYRRHAATCCKNPESLCGNRGVGLPQGPACGLPLRIRRPYLPLLCDGTVCLSVCMLQPLPLHQLLLTKLSHVMDTAPLMVRYHGVASMFACRDTTTQGDS